MSEDDVLIFGISRDSLKSGEDAPLFPDDLQEWGEKQQQRESHGQLDDVSPGGQPLRHRGETDRQLHSGDHRAVLSS